MAELGVGLGLVLVIEGLLYAAFPQAMKRFMVQMLDQPATVMRAAGLLAAALGVAVVWLVRH